MRDWLEWYNDRASAWEKILITLIILLVIGTLVYYGYYWFTHDCQATNDWVGGKQVWHCEPR